MEMSNWMFQYNKGDTCLSSAMRLALSLKSGQSASGTEKEGTEVKEASWGC